ncbi:MAG: winged helix-turn-helix transcriptional regulator [Candidatus Bathyarchaeia archaeon]
MKDVELKLISELMKNSRRSDRELAKAVGVSQPTVSRLVKRLEKDGIIKEYTMIPDFRKLGYQLLALTFVKLREPLGSEETEKARKIAKQKLEESHYGIVLLERGIGLGYDGVIVGLYEDYAAYTEHRNQLREFPFLEVTDVEGFLISLDDEVHYRPLTLQTLAKQLLAMKKKD